MLFSQKTWLFVLMLCFLPVPPLPGLPPAVDEEPQRGPLHGAGGIGAGGGVRGDPGVGPGRLPPRARGGD